MVMLALIIFIAADSYLKSRTKKSGKRATKLQILLEKWHRNLLY